MTPPTKADADALIARGQALLARGDLPKATELLNQAVRIYWAIGELYSAAAQTGNYGWALRRMGRADLARPYLEQAATIFADMGLSEFAERHRFAAEDVAADLTPELLASLPPAVRGALERGDGAALQQALDALPLAEQSLLYERLTAAGVISHVGGDTETAALLAQFEPLLQGVAAVARGEHAERAEIVATLADLERKGWEIRGAVEQIWRGQRKLAALTEKLDPADAALVRRVLEILAE